MIFVPGKIRTRRVECDKCGATLSAASLRSHLQTQHGIYQVAELPEGYLDVRPGQTYRAFRSVDGKLRCPVPGCVGEATTNWNLRRHFRDRHPRDLVNTPGEGVYPRCPECQMQTAPSATAHRRTAMCIAGGRRHRQYEAAAAAAQALRHQFTAYGDVLERVEVFKYLGRLVAMDDSDEQAMCRTSAKRGEAGHDSARY